MKSIRALAFLVALAFLPGCLTTPGGRLEVLHPGQAYGRTVAVLGDLHGENEEIEQRLASDLRQALAKRGLTLAVNPEEADLVIVPTIGRLRTRPPEPATPAGGSFQRFSPARVITRGDYLPRRGVPSVQAPAGAQQAGLLLTAYRGEDFRDYGAGRPGLLPVWRIYAAQSSAQMTWNSVAVPLINAAAEAARPLGKSGAERKKQAEARRATGPVGEL